MSVNTSSTTMRLLFVAVTFGLIAATPLLSVYFSRVLAYTPMVAGLIGAGILCFGYKRKIDWPKTLLAFIALFLGWAAFSCLWSPHPSEAFERVTKLIVILPLMAMFLAVIRSSSEDVPEKLWLWVLAVCAFSAALISIDIVASSPVYLLTRGTEMYKGFSTAVYNSGSLTVMLTGFTAFMLAWQQKKNRVWSALFALPVLAMLFFIQSQTTQVVLVIGLLFYFLFPSSKGWAWLALFIGMAIGMLIKPFLAHYVYEHFAAALDAAPALKEAYIAHRLEIWDYTGRYAMQSPFWGHGIEITRMVEAFDSKRIFNPTNTVLHPHSFIIQLWIEFGLIGVVFGVAALGTLMRFLMTRYDGQVRKIAIALLAMLLFAACSTYGMWQGWWIGVICTCFALLETGRALHTRS
jgi:O-antigen ligase